MLSVCYVSVFDIKMTGLQRTILSCLLSPLSTKPSVTLAVKTKPDSSLCFLDMKTDLDEWTESGAQYWL